MIHQHDFVKTRSKHLKNLSTQKSTWLLKFLRLGDATVVYIVYNFNATSLNFGWQHVLMFLVFYIGKAF